MKHLGTRTLETPRLILRPFRVDDAQAMFDNWAGDPEVTKYLTWPAHTGVNVSEFVLNEWVPLYDRDDHYQWAITLRELGDTPIGSIAAVRKDDLVEMVHIGYCIGRKWWRQGVVAEALAELIRFFFEDVGLNRVEARHDPRNPNSGRVMQKCGMKCEGTMRDSDRNNQGVYDATVYAILMRDYFNENK